MRSTLLMAFICLCACGPDRQSVIAEHVAKRIAEFKEKQQAKCRADLLETAGKAADSILLEAAKTALLDSLLRARPNRPLKPPAIPPIDTAKVKPIFQ